MVVIPESFALRKGNCVASRGANLRMIFDGILDQMIDIGLLSLSDSC
jgi:hypothetical protein